MEFSFDFGNLDDYVKKVVRGDDSVEYKGNRAAIRSMVEHRSKCMDDIALSGGNIYTWELDFNDAFYEFIDPIPSDAKIVVMNMFSDELLAAASAINDQTNKILAEAEMVESNGNDIVKWVGAAIIFLILLFIFGTFK